MNTTDTNTTTGRPGLTFNHPNARGTGGAVQFALRPARMAEGHRIEGGIHVYLAPQRGEGFDWAHALEFDLRAEDVGRVLERRARRAERRTAKRREANAGLLPWLRRDGRSHVVWTTTTHSRRANAKTWTGYWLFEDGKPRFYCGTGDDWRATARFAAGYSEILVWDNPAEEAGK